MEDAPHHLPDDAPDAHGDGRSSVNDRFRRVVQSLAKPKTEDPRRPLKAITSNEKRERLLKVQELAKLGMAVEQMADYLPTLGLPLSRSTLYEYLGQVHRPRWYKTSEGQQSHHDYFTFRFFIRIAQDAAGFRTHHLAKGTAPFDGARFRPDFRWEIGPYLFFLEAQLSDLTETRWSVKFRNYIRMRKTFGRPFRALFLIDQKGDLAYARRHARHVIEQLGGEGRNSLLFIGLSEMKGPANVATDPVWRNAWGEPKALLEYLPRKPC